MYEKESNTGHKVVWKPEHTDLAEQAIEKHKGKGVPENVTLPDEANVPVDSDTARSIGYTYKRLVLDRYIRAALDEGDEEIAEELKEEYQEHTGEEWEE